MSISLYNCCTSTPFKQVTVSRDLYPSCTSVVESVFSPSCGYINTRISLACFPSWEHRVWRSIMCTFRREFRFSHYVKFACTREEYDEMEGERG